MHIFGEILFVKPQNDTYTTFKRLKTMKNEKETYLGWSVVACRKIVSKIEFSNRTPPLTRNVSWIKQRDAEKLSLVVFLPLRRFRLIIIIDRFYIALFSAFEQTHCARMWFYMSQ